MRHAGCCVHGYLAKPTRFWQEDMLSVEDVARTLASIILSSTEL